MVTPVGRDAARAVRDTRWGGQPRITRDTEGMKEERNAGKGIGPLRG